jgi:hypothetical protein
LTNSQVSLVKTQYHIHTIAPFDPQIYWPIWDYYPPKESFHKFHFNAWGASFKTYPFLDISRFGYFHF